MNKIFVFYYNIHNILFIIVKNGDGKKEQRSKSFKRKMLDDFP